MSGSKDAVKVRLHVGYNGAGLHKIILNDEDVSNGFNYCCVEMRAGHLATMTLGAPVIEHGWVGGEVEIQILPETRKALIALGWTPPEVNPIAEVRAEGQAEAGCFGGCVDGCPHAL